MTEALAPKPTLGQGQWSTADFMVLSVYMLFVLLVSGVAGRCFVRMLDRGTITARSLYGTYNDLICGKTPPTLMASVMTKTIYQNRILMYDGFVDEVSFGSMRRINYISLFSATRFYAKMKDDHIDVAEARQANAVSVEPEDRLIISGDQILNILFRRIDGKKSDTESA